MRTELKIEFIYIIGLVLILMSLSCKPNKEDETSINLTSLLVANLGSGKSSAFDQVKNAFEKNNPGHQLDYNHQKNFIDTTSSHRIAFVQSGGGTATIGKSNSKFSIGDIFLLRPQQTIETDSLFSALIFSIPSEIPVELPSFIRPDWDDNITDIPGGCATETNAYRRILLTWKESVGSYIYHGLNAHRVRITNSFSHYHPVVGGFDEFYLVQMASPTAKLITSSRVDDIEGFNKSNSIEVENLTQSRSLVVGDLIYLPRGLMHRGMGNVLVQVITVPGFIPGAEIGVDYHLRKINERLDLKKEMAIPYNKEASEKIIIK